MPSGKRKLLLIVFILIIISRLSASISAGASFTPTLLWDGYPLIKEGASSATVSSLSFPAPESWERVQDSLLRFDSRESLLSAWLEITRGDVFFAVKMNIREELYNFISSTPWTNIPYVGNTKYAVTHAQYPHVAFVEYSSDYLFLSIGRRLWSLGPGKYSFLLSPVQPYLDSASFGLDYPEEKFSLSYRFFIISGSNATLNRDKKEDTDDVYKTVFIHEFSYERENLIIGFGELNLVYDTVPTLIDFSPFVLWHNQYQEEHSNVMIELSLEGRIGPVRLYGLYAQDDICLSNEGNNLKPTALGFAFGFDWLIGKGEVYTSPLRRDTDYAYTAPTLRTDGGIHLEGSFYWATNWLYNRRSSAQDGTFSSDRYGKIMLPWRFYSSNGGYTELENAYYLGYPYGPGTISAELGASYEDENMSVRGYISLMLRGEISIDTPVTEESKGKWLALEGDVLRIWTVGLEGERKLTDHIVVSLSSSFSVDSRRRFYPLLSLTFGTVL